MSDNPPPNLTPPPLRILVAEDDDVNQRVLEVALKKFGHIPIVANNGLELIQLLDNDQFDVVFVDVLMPKMDGIVATRHIRNSRKVYCNIPIIGLSGCAMKGDKERCLLAGMDIYLTKPFELRDIKQIVDTICVELEKTHPGQIV